MFMLHLTCNMFPYSSALPFHPGRPEKSYGVKLNPSRNFLLVCIGCGGYSTRSNLRVYVPAGYEKPVTKLDGLSRLTFFALAASLSLLAPPISSQYLQEQCLVLDLSLSQQGLLLVERQSWRARSYFVCRCVRLLVQQQ